MFSPLLPHCEQVFVIFRFSNYFGGIFSTPESTATRLNITQNVERERHHGIFPSHEARTSVCQSPDLTIVLARCTADVLAVYPGLSDCAALSPRSLVEVIRNFMRVLITFDNYFLPRDMRFRFNYAFVKKNIASRAMRERERDREREREREESWTVVDFFRRDSNIDLISGRFKSVGRERERAWMREQKVERQKIQARLIGTRRIISVNRTAAIKRGKCAPLTSISSLNTQRHATRVSWLYKMYAPDPANCSAYFSSVSAVNYCHFNHRRLIRLIAESFEAFNFHLLLSG